MQAAAYPMLGGKLRRAQFQALDAEKLPANRFQFAPPVRGGGETAAAGCSRGARASLRAKSLSRSKMR